MSLVPVTPSPLSAHQLEALRNLGRKHAGEAVDFINISDARALTALGYARREASGWRISDTGLALLASSGIVAKDKSSGEAISLRKYKDEGN